jgi:Zn-dependent protease with chaperone function
MEKDEIMPKNLVHKNEQKYFLLAATISVLTYVSLAISIVGLFIVLGFTALSLFLHALMIGSIRTNAVKLNERQFPEVYEKAKKLCEKMAIRQIPDIYVIESSGTLNAFATRFFGRNMVVLYSEIFELIEKGADDELAFVIAHELAHLKRNHISKSLFILPAMWIPGIGEMYLRACEYTCDRYAAYYTENPEAGKNALTILGIGKTLYSRVNRAEYMKQINQEKGFFVWLSEVLSTHPPLPKRIYEIEAFFGGEETISFPKKRQTAALTWLFIFVASLTVFGAGIHYFINHFTLPDMLASLEESYQEESYEEENEEIPPLIIEVANGNTREVKSLLDSGEYVDVEDSEGMTPLHWAVKSHNHEMVQILLDAGADVNHEDYYGTTPLMSAAELGNLQIIEKLIKAGGDVNDRDTEGMTPLMYAVFSENKEAVQLLLELGADPGKKDHQGMNALMHAIQSGNQEIIHLLQQSKSISKEEN